MNLKAVYFLLGLVVLGNIDVFSREYHVSVNGSDVANGSLHQPFKTISKASKTARAGDTITVHAGTYREWVDPLFGGTNEFNRILYRAAIGEDVIIKGSEVAAGWEKVRSGVWRLTLDNVMFGDYNPYQEIVKGDWFLGLGRVHHTGEVYLNGKSLYEVDSLEKVFNPKILKNAEDQVGSLYQWYCESNNRSTTIWANFQDVDPKNALIEINVRPTVFFPKSTGINYITVRGFRMSHAATNWAPPTAEQTGLIGPNWSKGWIIENNIISYSKCSGISLGKNRSTGQNYSSEYKVKNGHISQLETVFSALNSGWSKESIGSHIVRNNTIFNCEQTGICGAMGAIFSQIYNNHIYDIHVKRQWDGFEMGGIKLHAPIDVVIKDNCIHNAFKGIWIDWQAQGIRISGNLLYNNKWMDLHLEMSHGPHIIDNNIFLSNLNLWDLAVGSAFISNLFAGQICKSREDDRFTPYHLPHSTQVAGIMTMPSGDDRFINNIFIKTPVPAYDIFENARRPKREKGTMDFGLGMYDLHPATMPAQTFPVSEMSRVKLPVRSAHNLFLNGAMPYKNGVDDVIMNTSNVNLKVDSTANGIYLSVKTSNNETIKEGELVTGNDLGEAIIPGLTFDMADGVAVSFDHDYLKESRVKGKNNIGPFAEFKVAGTGIRLWPK
jgi:alpha-N-arabinofuranosidase